MAVLNATATFAGVGSLAADALPQSIVTGIYRASAATYFDAAIVLRSAAPNVPRTTYDPVTGAFLGPLIEAASTNMIANNTMAGAGVGVLPSLWSIDATVASSVLGADVTGNGMPYVDILLSGTTTAMQLGVTYQDFNSIWDGGASSWDSGASTWD
jgi:hypothetical protein